MRYLLILLFCLCSCATTNKSTTLHETGLFIKKYKTTKSWPYHKPLKVKPFNSGRAAKCPANHH
jgi:hypothetical protein